MVVGKSVLGKLDAINGIEIGVAEAGIKKPNRRDLVIFKCAQNTAVAGVFTKNSFCAAPVQLAKKHIQSDCSNRYLLINTGNANAGTGEQGLKDALTSCKHLASNQSVEIASVLPFSTGVIGEHLPMQKLLPGIEQACTKFSPNNWESAAHGILTTDTVPKGISVKFQFEAETITITGIAKGSGMIRPDMATMLSFVATDAPISEPMLQKLLEETTETSYNRITVDGDTSTNDSSILMATGTAQVSKCNSESDALYALFKKELSKVMLHLALSIIRDGEGATKLVTIDVSKAKNTQEACDVAYTIAHSPLVKTALYASDANWGRILAAVGRAPLQDLDVDRVDISINGVKIVSGGGRDPHYTEEMGAAEMAKEEITILVELHRGDVSDRVYTTDLSHDYVSINANYRS